MKNIASVTGVILIFTLLSAVAGSSKQAAEPVQAVIVRSASIKAGPSFGSKTVVEAAIGQTVVLGKRTGGWQQVTRLGDKAVEGWLRTYQIRTDIEPQDVVVERKSGQGETGLAGLSRRTSSLFTRRETTSNQSLTAAMGVRGLSEADLENAEPDVDELQRFKAFAGNVAVATAFAKEGGLQASKIKPLPEPKKKK